MLINKGSILMFKKIKEEEVEVNINREEQV